MNGGEEKELSLPLSCQTERIRGDPTKVSAVSPKTERRGRRNGDGRVQLLLAAGAAAALLVHFPLQQLALKLLLLPLPVHAAVADN